MTVGVHPPDTLPGMFPETAKDVLARPAMTRMLEFSYCGKRYIIDLEEVMGIIRGLMLLQSEDPGSVSRHLIRVNRRDTIVFDIERCLAMGRKVTAEKTGTSFILLDEKIGELCVGILVPGVPCAVIHAGTRNKGEVTGGAGMAGGKKGPAPLIDIAGMVCDCIIQLQNTGFCHNTASCRLP